MKTSSEISDSEWVQSPILGENGYYVIRGYADVAKALKDLRFERSLVLSSGTPVESQCPWMRFKELFSWKKPNWQSTESLCKKAQKSFFFSDGQDYARLYSPVKKLFLTRLQAVQGMLDSAAEQRLAEALRLGTCEWGETVVRPYVGDGIHALFDFPEGLSPDLYNWFSHAVLMPLMDPRFEKLSRSRYENLSKAATFIEKCLASPKLEKTKGLMIEISRLSGSPTFFNRDEVNGNILFLIMAATFTVPRTLARTVKTLLEKPDLIRQLQKNPSLIPSAIQEFIRIHTPAFIIQRKVTEDVLIKDVTLKKGDWVYIDVISANMDTELFESPEQFQADRSPNPHQSFGGGLHYCLGAPMARMQMEAFLKAFIKKSENTLFELIPDPQVKSRANERKICVKASPRRAA